MDVRKALVYAALALGALVFLRVAVLLVAGLVRVLQTVTVTVVLLLLAGLVLYGGYKLFARVRDTEAPPSDEQTDRVAVLKQQYASGDLSRDEFERRLEQELDTSAAFDPDVPLDRERE